MPPAEEKLQEKIPFDVYAMMLILSFLAFSGAIAFLHNELQDNWYANEVVTYDEDDQPINPPEHAVNLTYFNKMDPNDPDVDDTATVDSKNLREIVVTESDIAEYEILNPDGLLKVVEYPKGIDPLVNPVSPDPDVDNTANWSEEDLQKLADTYTDEANPAVKAEGDVEAAPAPEADPPAE